MKISVLGLGYVGTVAAACLAERGCEVVVTDTNAHKCQLLAQGKSPVYEAGLDELVEHGVTKGLLRVVASTAEAVAQTDILLICVGTPSAADGSVDLSALEAVCHDIGAALAQARQFHVVVIRSTVPPGTLMTKVIPWLEHASGCVAGKDFGVCNNPEFLREGSAVEDFFNPSKTVIGSSDAVSAQKIEALYAQLGQKIIHCPIEVAEMVKYADNAFHALKITFANEIGRLCKSVTVDSHAVMDIFCQDTKLNISRAYLKPGFAFGGSCLPKDLRSVVHTAHSNNISLPLLEAVMPSNQAHIADVEHIIERTGKQRVGILGLSFKATTDDVRESPLVALAERLMQKGGAVAVYDALAVGVSAMLEKQRVHSIEALCASSDVIVIGHNTKESLMVAQYLQPHHHIIDLVRISSLEAQHEQYDGICW